MSCPTHGTAGPFSRLSHQSWWWPVVQTNWWQTAAALHATQPSRPSFAAKKHPTGSQARGPATAGQLDGTPTVSLKARWPVQTNQTQSGCNSIGLGCTGTSNTLGGLRLQHSTDTPRGSNSTHTEVVITAPAKPGQAVTRSSTRQSKGRTQVMTAQTHLHNTCVHCAGSHARTPLALLASTEALCTPFPVCTCQPLHPLLLETPRRSTPSAHLKRQRVQHRRTHQPLAISCLAQQHQLDKPLKGAAHPSAHLSRNRLTTIRGTPV